MADALNNERFLKRYADRDKTILQRAGSWLKTLLKRSKTEGNEEISEVAEKMMTMIDIILQAETTGESKGGTRYELGYTTENRAIAIIKDDIFQGKFDELSEKERVKIVKNAIKSFRPGIPISGKLISVSRKTVEHFIGSNYTDSLRNHNHKLYEDKLKISQNIDDVVYASTNYINEGLLHQRDDNIIEFARGSVLLDIAGNKYEAQVLVGYTTMKELLLYDIQDMVPTNFTIKTKRTQPSLTGNKSDIRKTVVSSNNSIHQNEPIVNTSEEKNITKADLSETKSQRFNPEEPDIRYDLADDVAEEKAEKSSERSTSARKSATVYDSIENKKITIGMSDSDRAEVLKNTKLEVVVFKDETDELSDEEVIKLRDTYKSQAEKIVRTLAKKFGVFADYSNENIDLEFNYSSRSLGESVHKQNDRVLDKSHADFYDFAKMLYVFDDVVKCAQPIEAHSDKYVGTKRANSNLKQTYILLSAFEEGKYIVPIEFNIKEFSNGDKNKLYVSVTLQKIEVDLMEHPPQLKTATKNSKPTSIYSITDILKNVNPHDKYFLKYIPDSLLDHEQIKAKNEALEEDRIRLDDMRYEYAVENNPDKANEMLSAKAKSEGYTTDPETGTVYKSGSENVKTTDITYDDDGKLIPISKRYDDSAADVRYDLADDILNENGEVKDEYFAAAVSRMQQGTVVNLETRQERAERMIETHKTNFNKLLRQAATIQRKLEKLKKAADKSCENTKTI